MSMQSMFRWLYDLEEFYPVAQLKRAQYYVPREHYMSKQNDRTGLNAVDAMQCLGGSIDVIRTSDSKQSHTSCSSVFTADNAL